MGSHEQGSEALVIASIEDVARLRSPARLWNLHGSIELQIPGLAQPEREQLESRLNELSGVCGCAEGSAAGAIALIAIAYFWIQREIAFSYQSIFAAGAIVIGASLLAKLVRVIAARVLLRQMLGELVCTLTRDSPAHQRGAMP